MVPQHIRREDLRPHAERVAAFDDRRPRRRLQRAQWRVGLRGDRRLGAERPGIGAHAGGIRLRPDAGARSRRKRRGIRHREQLKALCGVADKRQHAAVGRDVRPRRAAGQVRQLARRIRAPEVHLIVNLIEVEWLVLARHRHDDGAAVGPPGGCDRAVARIGRHDPSRLRGDVNEGNLGRRAESMTFHRYRPAVRRPSGRIELRIRLRDERFDLPRGLSRPGQARLSARPHLLDQHKIASSRSALHRDEGLPVWRKIGIEQTCVRRHPTYAPAGARPLVQIAVDAGVAPEILLIEVDRVAADGRRRSEDARRQPARSGAIETNAIERRKRMRRLNGIDELRRAGGADEAIEPGAGHVVMMVRDAREPRVGRREGDAVRHRGLIVAPQVTKRLTVHAWEDPRTGVGHPAGGGLGQYRQLLGTESVNEILMEPGAVGVRGLAARPVHKAAVDAIEGLERTLPRGFILNGPEVSVEQAPFAGDGAFFVGREAFDLPGRQIEIRKGKRHAPKDIPDYARPALRTIEVRDMRELMGKHQPQPVVLVADQFRTGGPRGGQHDSVVGDRCGRPSRLLGLIREDDVREQRRLHVEPLPDRLPRLFRDDSETTREAILALVKIDDEVRRSDRAKAEGRVEKGRRPDGRGAQPREQPQRADQFPSTHRPIATFFVLEFHLAFTRPALVRASCPSAIGQFSRSILPRCRSTWRRR